MPGFPTKTVVTPTNRGKARRYNESCEVDFGFDDEEGVGGGAAGGTEIFACRGRGGW
jgi:hypothetical protein